MSNILVKRTVQSPEVNSERLLRRIRELAAIGTDEAGGITREGFSAADRRARAYLMQEARSAGLTAAVDAAGNVLMRRPATAGPERPALLIGSHLDTVVNAGPLDGAYGVLAALEVVQCCAEAGIPTGLDVVAAAFANEEGALFPQPFWGSMALAGRLAELPLEPADHHGTPLRAALREAGGDLDALGSAVWTPGSVAAYLELHIEQGPILERAGLPIGVVEAITGRVQLTVEIDGRPGHSGTTPMPGRRDALTAASRLILAAEEISRDQGLCRVATVGHLETHPNTPNTIPGAVTLTVDLRDTDARQLAAAEAALNQALTQIATTTGTGITVTAATRSTPVATDARLRAAVADSATALGLAHMALPSGAGHDAQMIADIAPIAMIFVPSIGGVSHVPEEDTAQADLVGGARVLLRTALHVAGAHL